MWALYTILGYLVLAVTVPVCWALGRAWRQARAPRIVTCPESGRPAMIGMDPLYAVRMHVRGDPEWSIRSCSFCPDHRDCARDCLVHVQAA